MTAESVFRFVAIRPPVEGDREGSDEHRSADAEDRYRKRLAELEERGVSPGRARLMLAHAVLESPTYAPLDPRWSVLLRAASRVRALLDAVWEHCDRRRFKDDSRKLLESLSIQDFDVSDLVNRDDYDDLRAALWISYFANVALVDERPGDREPMVSWMCFLTLLEATALSDEEFEKLVTDLRTARPVVPFDLTFATKDERSVPGLVSPDPPDRRAMGLGDDLARAWDIRAALEAGYRDNVVVAARAEATIEPLALADGVAEAPSRVYGSSPGEPPWRMRVGEIDAPEAAEVLASLGFRSDDIDIADALDALDARIASLTTAFTQSTDTTETVAVGGVFTSVQRSGAHETDIEAREVRETSDAT